MSSFAVSVLVFTPIIFLIGGIVATLMSLLRKDFRKLALSLGFYIVSFTSQMIGYLILQSNHKIVYESGKLASRIYGSDLIVFSIIISGLLLVLSLGGLFVYFKYSYVPQLVLRSSLLVAIISFFLFFGNAIHKNKTVTEAEATRFKFTQVK